MQRSGFRPDKTRAASFFEWLQKHLGKACVKRVPNNDALVNVGNKHRKKRLNATTNKEVLSGFKTTARDVLSTI